MKIHTEGYKILIISFLILLLINIALYVPGSISQWLKLAVLIPSVSLFGFLLVFFRLPAREVAANNSIILAPADGKLVVIEETFESEYFKAKCLQVSIFMSPLNMHSNRYPVSGTVVYTAYHPGDKIVAWHPKSSELNERSSVVIKTDNGNEILVRQIAGAVARRIVTYSKPGQIVKQGDELGFIKFGSRVDIFLPAGTKTDVPLCSKVKANKTVIARI
jgi:phosphatidylserine decarboxylase